LNSFLEAMIFKASMILDSCFILAWMLEHPKDGDGDCLRYGFGPYQVVPCDSIGLN
jgi:hypothetical protein